jgi:two-component system, OmpR family, sensor kinase
LLTVIVALTVPLAVNLRERAKTDLIGEAKITAQALAAVVGAEALAPSQRDQLTRRAERYQTEIDGRVLIMDQEGIVLADANPLPDPPTSAVGQNYNTPERPEIGRALVDGQPDAQIRRSERLDKDILVAAAPIIDDDAQGGPPVISGAVRITFDVQAVTNAVRNVTIGIVVIGFGGLLAGMLIAFGLAGSLARPLTKLAATAKRLGSGDLSARAGDIKGPKEVEDLASSFDEMADRVERTFDSQRSFVANASHQLRTPLTGMKLRIERARDDTTDPDIRRQLESADHEVDRMAGTIDRMLDMALEIEQGVSTTVDLRRAATEAVARWQDRGGDQAPAVVLSVSGDEGPTTAHANPTDIDQIIDNLIDNAVSYAPGSIEIRAERRNGRACLAVRDHGPGIPEEEQTKVTERFYRGKDSPAGGSGLGLAIARDLTEKWGGTLVIDEADGGGTRIEVQLRPAPGTTEVKPSGNGELPARSPVDDQ